MLLLSLLLSLLLLLLLLPVLTTLILRQHYFGAPGLSLLVNVLLMIGKTMFFSLMLIYIVYPCHDVINRMKAAKFISNLIGDGVDVELGERTSSSDNIKSKEDQGVGWKHVGKTLKAVAVGDSVHDEEEEDAEEEKVKQTMKLNLDMRMPENVLSWAVRMMLLLLLLLLLSSSCWLLLLLLRPLLLLLVLTEAFLYH